MIKKICANCGQTQGPFTLVKVDTLSGAMLRVCGPVQLDPETKKLVEGSRVPLCNARRKKQEIERFGNPENPYA